MKCKMCNKVCSTLYLHINRSDIKKKWIPVVYYCPHCDRLDKRIYDYKTVYRDTSNFKYVKGKPHTKDGRSFCGCLMVKLYRKANTRKMKGWIPLYWYCPYCDKIVAKIKN